MKKYSLLILIILVSFNPLLIADQPLDSAQTLDIFKSLCQQPTTGWISKGHIEAMHRTEDMRTGLTTDTTETIVTDGDRFIWQIQIDSRKGERDANIENDASFMRWNQDRMFVWDGQTYTMYYQPGNHAIVYDSDVSIPFGVNGALTAGHIPWGNGLFSYKRLSTAKTIASKVQTESGQEIHITILYPNTPKIILVLDPERNNTVLSYELLRPGISKIVHTYANFAPYGGQSIPMSILIDRYDGNESSPKLLSSDSWEVISLDDHIDKGQTFKPAFKEKALIEHYTSILDTATFHRHSKKADTKLLFDQRVLSSLKKQVQKQNCSTVAISHILEKLDIGFEDSELFGLIDEDTVQTTLYDIQKFIRSKGLYCKAVKTNIEKLRQLQNCQVMLHYPDKKHFVVLDRLDEENAWIIDLSRQMFYDCLKHKRFREDWSLGTALLISTDKNAFEGKGHQLPEDAIKQTVGSGNYSCSEVIQEDSVPGGPSCPLMSNNICGGIYQVFQRRLGCQQNESGGPCVGTEMIGGMYSECVESSEAPGTCDIDSSFCSFSIRACL